MLSAIIVLTLCIVIGLVLISRVKTKYPFIDSQLLSWLLAYHFFFCLVYYLYALFNPSDSKFYFNSVIADYGRIDWLGMYGTSTTFIRFIAYPFLNYLSFSYEAMMVLFSFFGYLGFLCAYIFLKENIRFKHYFFGVDLITVFIFLPNLHFWSSSLGKGAVIFLGMGLFFFGISRFKKRIAWIFIGGILIYHVRPHVMLVILAAGIISLVFSSKGISLAARISLLLGACVSLIFIYQDVLSMVGINEDEFLSQGMDLTHRASELTKATSGIDITSYSLPEQLFAFVFRPLFFDAPGMLGLIVSFENVFYLVMALKIVNLSGFRFVISASFLVKVALLSFLVVSIALAQVSGNLGLAIRQKSQVMILFLFVVISFLDAKKMAQYKRMLRAQWRKSLQTQ